MNTIPAIAILAAATPLMLQIIFWVLLVLWIIGAFGWNSNPNWPRASSVVILIELAILGWAVFGF